jgi:hypothetical protein
VAVAMGGALVALLTGCAGAQATDLTASSPPASPRSASEVPTCPDPTTDVATAEELQHALDSAKPGDVIRLADGEYAGEFTISSAGTPDAPIYLCGGDGAVLKGAEAERGYVLHLDGAAYWTLIGFEVRGGLKGIMADGVKNMTIAGLTISGTGNEAVHLRRHSVDNLIVGNDISDTGSRDPEFGEGVYIGSAESNWCDLTDCEPDASDRNRVVGNTISGTTAESVDVKEGTTGGEIAGNSFDGSAMTEGDSWVDVKGNDWQIRDNTGSSSPGDGFQVHDVEGWGTGNEFSGNVARVDGPGFGFAVGSSSGTLVACTNEVTGAAKGFSDIECDSTKGN